MAVGARPLDFPLPAKAKPSLVCAGPSDRPPGLCQRGWGGCRHPPGPGSHVGALSTSLSLSPRRGTNSGRPTLIMSEMPLSLRLSTKVSSG